MVTVFIRTTFIMVGDGRNNYNDPRLEIFKNLARRSRRTISSPVTPSPAIPTTSIAGTSTRANCSLRTAGGSSSMMASRKGRISCQAPPTHAAPQPDSTSTIPRLHKRSSGSVRSRETPTDHTQSLVTLPRCLQRRSSRRSPVACIGDSVVGKSLHAGGKAALAGSPDRGPVSQ